MLSLSDLVPSVAYCVVRDSRNVESLIASGRRIVQMVRERSLDVQYFRPNENAWSTYVMVECGDGTRVGIWRDPTRPELNGGEAPLSLPGLPVEVVPEEIAHQEPVHQEPVEETPLADGSVAMAYNLADAQAPLTVTLANGKEVACVVIPSVPGLVGYKGGESFDTKPWYPALDREAEAVTQAPRVDLETAALIADALFGSLACVTNVFNHA